MLDVGPPQMMRSPMYRPTEIRAAMQRARDTHVSFKRSWGQWWSTRPERWPEPDDVVSARKAHLVAQDMLFDKYLMPIDSRLRESDTSCIDDAIAVLSIDIHAFRVGYLKAAWLRRIKRLPLTPVQVDELRAIALGKLVARHAGREMVEWNRLLARVATADDVAAIRELCQNRSQVVRSRAERTLRSILSGRRSPTPAATAPRWGPN